MEPATAQKLRALNWAAITTSLHKLAAAWTRLRVDHLPIEGRTLTSLQVEYRDLLDAMPVSSAPEVETALWQFVRGLRLKGDAVTATQQKYVQEHCAPPRFRPLLGAPVPTTSNDGSYEYLRPLLDAPDTPARVISMGALYYVGAHRSLGGLLPTFTDALRDRFREAPLRAALVDPEGRVTLDGVLKTHSRYIAELVACRKAEPIDLADADRPDYGDLADEEAGTWLDDVLADESEDEESSGAIRPGRPRQHRLHKALLSS
jgi:hypothetical protein